MKIIFFHTYNQGYLSNFFFEISEKLVQEGHTVYNFGFKSQSTRRRKKGVSIIIKKNGSYLYRYFHILKQIIGFKPDIIVANFGYTNPAILFGRLLGVKKKITWFHSLRTQTGATQNNIKIKSFFLKLADLVVANSYFTKEELIEVYGVKESKIKSVPFWTNIDKMPEGKLEFKVMDPTENTIKIGCPGRFSSDKNQYLLIKAMAALPIADRENIRIFFAGRNNAKDKTMQLINKHTLSGQIIFCDHLSPSEMVSFYKSMDLIILPSLYEAFGLVFIEAIALGTPVLVSKSFGALTFIDKSKIDFEEFIFDPNSEIDLRNKIQNFLRGNAKPGSYFKEVYSAVYNKEAIYQEIKTLLFSK